MALATTPKIPSSASLFGRVLSRSRFRNNRHRNIGAFRKTHNSAGIAKPCKDRICTSQFLLRDIPDEPGAIWALVSQLEPKSVTDKLQRQKLRHSIHKTKISILWFRLQLWIIPILTFFISPEEHCAANCRIAGLTPLKNTSE